MSPLSLVDEEKIQRLLDEVAEKFSIHTTLQDAEGTNLLEGGTYSTLCSAIRSKPGVLPLVCGQSNKSMFATAVAEGGPSSDLCEIGLFKTVVPVFHEGAFVGGLSACGIALEDEMPEPFLVSKVLEIDESEAESFVHDVRVVTSSRAREITRALENGYQAALRQREQET